MGLKDALGSMQRCLGEHAAVVHVAVKIRNQCNGIIRYHLGEDNVSSAFFLHVEQPCMDLNWPGELRRSVLETRPISNTPELEAIDAEFRS